MTCSFCGLEFTREDAKTACGRCLLAGCRNVRCPRCGYEMPPEPGWIRWLRNKWRQRRKKANGTE